MPSRQYKARAKRRAEYLQKNGSRKITSDPEPKLTAEEERYHQNSDRKQAAEWEKYHKNPEPIVGLSLKQQRYNENKAAMNSAEHRDDSIASPAKRIRLQERPTDQHAARGKCDHKDNELRKKSTNKPQRRFYSATVWGKVSSY
ncbi:hypothetical protein EMCRGX_G025110 [Ephydatia muelleri]